MPDGTSELSKQKRGSDKSQPTSQHPYLISTRLSAISRKQTLIQLNATSRTSYGDDS